LAQTLTSHFENEAQLASRPELTVRCEQALALRRPHFFQQRANVGSNWRESAQRFHVRFTDLLSQSFFINNRPTYIDKPVRIIRCEPDMFYEPPCSPNCHVAIEISLVNFERERIRNSFASEKVISHETGSYLNIHNLVYWNDQCAECQPGLEFESLGIDSVLLPKILE
jgi:hypothetical protein